MTLFASLLVAAAATIAPAEVAKPSFVYFGTYTRPGKSRGIYASTFDAETGRLGPPRLVAETENPSFLALHPTRPLLYAVNEINNFEGEAAGSVTAFAIDPKTGDLRALGRVSSKGADPCHLAVDRSARQVLVANYSGGSVASLPIRPDGGLRAAAGFVQHTGKSVDARRQTKPHAHMVETDPKNRFALVADLGLDQILVYRFDAVRARLQPATPPHGSIDPGSGPRHFAFSPDGRDLYLLNEMTITVKAFRFDNGRLAEFQTVSALPAGVQPGPPDSGAEILVHPNGRFVYASTRGPDALVIFARDAATGKLDPIGPVASGGVSPRSFGIDPSGRTLLAANQRSDQVTAFRIDPETGRLTPTGQVLEIGAPVSVTFFPAAKRR